jgi:hypothetical protein
MFEVESGADTVPSGRTALAETRLLLLVGDDCPDVKP